MPKNMPQIEIDEEYSAPHQFESIKHARRHDGVRGTMIDLATGNQTRSTFLAYYEAVKLYEALGNALAFLDADDEPSDANNPMPELHDLDTLVITKTTPRDVGGTWVDGTIAGHRFEALVFEGHAACESYEIGDSRISKFHLADGRGTEVACFDRGWDRQPTTDAAKRITDLLAAGLAETVFGK